MFQCGDVIFVVEHRFVVTCIFRGNLIQEALRLIFRVIQLAKAVTDFTTTDKELKAVCDFRVNVVTTRQRRNFCWIFSNEGRLNQMCFCHFFEDLGNDTAQTPALLNVDADRFSNRFRRVEVVQICHVGFRAIFLDRFTHGQFFERFTEVQRYVAVGHFRLTENILCQSTEQRFGQLDQIFVICVSHIEFHHGELWVMTYGNTFVTEVTVDFEYTLEATNHQTLEVQFRRDTQVHVEIQRVMVGDKRTRSGTARDHLHHRRFNFHKAAVHHELANTREDLRAHFKGVAGFIVRDEIQITLTIARFLILQAVEFIRQRTQCFGQQTQLGAVDRQFAGFGFEQFTFRAEDVAEVPFFELLIVNAFRQIVTGNVQLNAATHILQGNERRFTHNTAGHHAASNGDFDVQRFQFFVLFTVEFCVQLVRGMIATEIVREGNPLLAQVRQLLTTRFQFIVKIDYRVSALCVLFRHVGSS